MLSAVEARKMTFKVILRHSGEILDVLKKIENLIKESINKGEYTVNIDFDDYDLLTVSALIEVLRNNGYEILSKKYGGITISWNNAGVAQG